MSDVTNAAEALAADADEKPPTQEEAKALADTGGAEGTTPEEVASVLKSAGIKVDSPKAAAPDDSEEGDDPDTEADEEPAAPGEAEPAADDEPAGDDEEEPAAPVEPVEPPAAPDAGADDDKYSLQVEDANGTTYKISVGAKMEDILSEFEPKNNGQILDILSQLGDLKDQKAQDDRQAAEDAQAAERQSRAGELLKGWGEEATALQGSQRIPEGADGDKRINQVYKFMADENEARMKAGRPTLNSFEDALDKLENQEARDKAAADAKAAKEEARKNGGKVGGASAPASGRSTVYKAGTARNANQAIRALGLLED